MKNLVPEMRIQMGADVVGWRLYAFYPHFTLIELSTERTKHRLHALFIGGVIVLYRRIAEPSFLIALPSLLSPVSHELVTHKTPEFLRVSSCGRSHPFIKGSTGFHRLRRCDPACHPTKRSALWPPRVTGNQWVMSTVTLGGR